MIILKCLILDDDKMSAEVLKHYIDMVDNLELIGVFSSVHHILDAPETKSVDIIFTDIQSLIDVNSPISKQFSNAHIIVVTTYSSIEVDLKLDNLQIVDYLTRPFSYNRFKESIQKIYFLKAFN